MTTTQAITDHLNWSHEVARRAHRSLPPSVDLEDLQQVASMALMRCAAMYDERPQAGYKQGTPFRLFAWRKVYYSCLMAYRGRHYRDVTHEELTEIPSGDTERAAVRSTALQALADAVLQLPPIHAAVISLRYFHSLTVVEVARELQISEGWCSQKGTEGLAMLKQELERKGIHGLEDVL